jgi:ferric iron reductase protein FhuF
MASAAAPDEVTAAMARAGAGNPLLSMGTGPGLPAERLTTSAGTVDLVAAVAARLGHPEPRVAASMVVLGYAARLVGPTLAVLLRDAILVDARPAQVRYTYHPQRGFTLTLPHPAGWHPAPDRLAQAWCDTVIDAHLDPLIRAVRTVTPVAAGLLWGNVASGITGALGALADRGSVALDRCQHTGLVLLDHGPLRGSGHLTTRNGRLHFRRRSCCLYYRLDGGGTCGDCPLPAR